MSDVSVSKTNVAGIESESKARVVKDSVSKKSNHDLEVSFIQLLTQHSDTPIFKPGGGLGKKVKNGSGGKIGVGDGKNGVDLSPIGSGTISGRHQGPDLVGSRSGHLGENAVPEVVNSGNLSVHKSSASVVVPPQTSNTFENDSQSSVAPISSNAPVQGGTGTSSKTLPPIPGAGNPVLKPISPMASKQTADPLQPGNGVPLESETQIAGSAFQFSRENLAERGSTPAVSSADRYRAEGPKAGSDVISVDSSNKKERGSIENQSAVDYQKVIQPDTGGAGFRSGLLGVGHSQSQSSTSETLPNFSGNFDINHFSEAISRPLVSGSGLYRVSVSLHPAELGQVSALLTLDKNNLLVTITPQTQAGHQALSESIKDLEQSLSSNGLRVSVTLSDSSPNREDQGWSPRSPSTRNVSLAGAEVSEMVEVRTKELGQIHIVL